ncbi:MAG: YitT family protein [Defluviitaleaceae bacterium]|nr:YitT family protein [Defluviitaleaceae bacterium]
MKKTIQRTIYEYMMISLGCYLLAAGISFFLQPHNFVIGGVSGLGIIIQHYTGTHFDFVIPVWLTNIAINLPLLLFALRIFGIKFITKTIYATFFLSLSLFINEFVPIENFQSDFFLASVFGGFFAGLGTGIVLKSLATTGGSDLAASIIQHFKKHLSVSKVLMVIDWCIIILGFFFFGSTGTMYAIIAVYVSAKAIDFVLEGLNFAIGAFIISDKADEIGIEINDQMDRGVTSLRGAGVYTGQEKNILLCVVPKKEIVQLKEIVSGLDKDAFVIVTDVREALGEGFTYGKKPLEEVEKQKAKR